MSQALAVPTPDNVPNTHPTGFYFFFWGEFAERASYYGMRAVLIIYLTSVLHFSDPHATQIYSYFKAACYLLPLVGGFLADRYFGKYWTIVGFSIPYVIGQFMLAIPDQTILILAMVLLACGSGVIKPNISTLMGLTYDQKRPGKLALRNSAFNWFYFAINVGATLSMLILPLMRDWLAGRHYSVYLTWTGAEAAAAPMGGGWFGLVDPLYSARLHAESGYAFAYPFVFMVPAFLMMGALAAFALGKKHYAVEVIDRTRTVSPEERREQWKTLSSLFGLFALMVFFWVAYENNDTTWVLFARDKMDRTIDLGFWKKEFAPDGFQFLNGLMVLACIPIFDWAMRKIDPEVKVLKPTLKMLMGFVITALSAGVMALAAMQAEGGAKASGWWMVLAFLVLTIGEVLIYGTGLELAYSAAPASMKGFITACFLLTNTGGNLINSELTQLYNTRLTPAAYFQLVMGITLVAALAFFFVGRRFNKAQATALLGPEPTPLLGDPVDMERN